MATRDGKSHHVLGVVLVLGAVAFFVVMNLTTRYMKTGASGAALPSYEKGFFRMAVGLVILLAMAGAGVFRIRVQNPRLWILRGVIGGLIIPLYFYAIDNTTLARATFFFYTYMAWGTVFAWLFLSEPLGRRRLPAVFVLYAGAVIMLVDASAAAGETAWRGDLAGLCCGVLAGGAATSMRALHRSETSWMIFMSMCVFGTVVCALFFASEAGYVAPGAVEWLLLFVIGLAGTAGHLFLTAGFKHLDVATVGALEMSAAPATAVAAYFLLSESMTPASMAGGALVVGGATYLALTSRAKTMERRDTIEAGIP